MSLLSLFSNIFVSAWIHGLLGVVVVVLATLKCVSWYLIFLLHPKNMTCPQSHCKPREVAVLQYPPQIMAIFSSVPSPI